MSGPAGRNCSGTGFKALMATQSFGALNDNVFKTVLSLIIADKLMNSESGSFYLSLAHALFILPFIVLSPFAGYFADRYGKHLVMRYAKFMELCIALPACFFFLHEHLVVLYGLLFLMGVHSTLFSPAKYGILPEILEEKELSRGNGFLEFWTFAAIIGGLALGGLLKSISGDNLFVPGIVIILFACAGLVCSLFLDKVPARNPSAVLPRNPFSSLFYTTREVAKSRPLILTLLAIAYFWFMGALFNINIYLFVEHHLHVSDLATSFLLVLLALGTGFGSIIAGKVSEGRVELGLVPIGSFGIAVSCVLLWAFSGSYFAALVFLSILGVSAGFFIVPLQSYFQAASPETQRGQFIALQNSVSFTGMLGATLVMMLLTDAFHLRAGTVFLMFGLASIPVIYLVTTELPEAFIRCVNWLLSHILYRVTVSGADKIPETGGVLIVSNHISFADPPLLLSAIPRPIRFLMYRPIYENKFIHPFAKALGAIPIAAEGGPKALIASINIARDALERGEIVCIFAEGAISRIGNMLPFGKGLERITDGLNIKVIPAYLDELWGSIFSYRDGKFFWKLPKEIPYPMTISFGDPLSADTPAPVVRQVIQELGVKSFESRRRRHRLLHLGFLSQAKRTPFRLAVTDTTGGKARFFELLAGTLALCTLLKDKLVPSKMVGIMLPPSLPGVLANLAVTCSGSVAVNLNHTISSDGLEKIYQKTAVETVLTSKIYLKKIGIEPRDSMIFLEDLLREIHPWRKVFYAALSLLAPQFLIERFFFARNIDQESLATVMFSSGSTGDPKGVMLTHRNISSNLESLYELLQLQSSDRLLGVLPFFHSFGFTGTLWLPLLGGICACYHPNPLDPGAIGKLAHERKTTILMSTPTFLQLYMKKIEAEQFKTLRFVVVGAEKLQPKIAEAFEEKFGVMPLEGYGCTELSPVALVNLPNIDERGVRQVGQKLGSAGHPIPGVAVRILDLETGEIRKVGESGMLQVKGPNVMKGYLGDPALTSQVITDGWYVTGDIASIDSDGFVTITDRLSRFSKIGGEMVPHLKVEERLHEILNSTDQVCAVTGVPDEKKGEKLIVLHTVAVNSQELVSKLAESGLPNLWIPKAENFFLVDALPLLGTGKLDLKGIKELAKAKSTGS